MLRCNLPAVLRAVLKGQDPRGEEMDAFLTCARRRRMRPPCGGPAARGGSQLTAPPPRPPPVRVQLVRHGHQRDHPAG